MGRIAITGTASSLGSRVLRRLVKTRGPEAVVAVDIAPPPTTLAGVGHRLVDFTQPVSDQRLLDAFREEEVDSVLHFAFFTNPQRDKSYAHELESIGTLNLLAAAAAAGIERVVVRSFTAVYGARGQNPNFLTEERPLEPRLSLPWVRDKVEAEGHVAGFLRRYPDMRISVLRMAPLFGPGIRNFYTAIFDKRVVPNLLGYDPLVQLLHPDDAVRAVELALEKAPRGALNVVPSAAIPLNTALHLAEKIPFAVPHPLAYLASDVLWTLGLAEAPGAFVDYVRYLFVAEGAKAERELGFVAQYSSRDALAAYLKHRYPARARREAEVSP